MATHPKGHGEKIMFKLFSFTYNKRDLLQINKIMSLNMCQLFRAMRVSIIFGMRWPIMLSTHIYYFLLVVSKQKDLSRCALDTGEDALESVVDERTALVAMGAASNGVGTVHDITTLCQRLQMLSRSSPVSRALTFVDVSWNASLLAQQINMKQVNVHPLPFK